MPSKNYRTADKHGLLDFLSGGKQTVLPGSPHPAGGNYIWTTERTLLDTPLAELPEFTGAHVADMEDVLRRFGWDVPECGEPRGEVVRRQAREAGVVSSDDDGVNTAALANLSAWVSDLGLPKLRRRGGGYRAVAPWRGSGSGRTNARRGSNLGIHPTGIVDFGTGDTFSAVTLAAKAHNLSYGEALDWLREKLGLPAKSEPEINLRNSSRVAPSYADNRVSLDEATARLQVVTGDDFAADILSGIFTRNQAALKPPLILPVHPVKVVRSEAGIGKTHTAIAGVAKQVRLGRHIIYVVPRLDLADQIAADFAAHSVRAEVYRGYEQIDPRAPDFAMCRNPPAYKAARDLGVGIRDSVCERRIDGETIRCPLASKCGMERQREARPQVWIVTTALLFIKRPDFIFDPDAIVIDESFIDNAIGDTVQVDVSALLESKVEGCSDSDHDAVTRYRMRLVAAIQANGDGPLSRAALNEQEIDAEDAYWVGWLEQRRITSSVLRPDMREGELKTAAYRHSARNKLARDAGALWHEIAVFLEEWKIETIIGDRSRSGRIAVAGGNKVSVTPLRTVHQSWRGATTLVLDATAPPASLMAIALGEIEILGGTPVVTEQPDVAARWPDYIRVRQILGAPVSMGKLGLVEFSGPKPRNVRDIVRFIRLRAALAAPDQIGVITYKGLFEQIEGQLPANVVTRHFGALAGMNDMEDVAGLIVIGRPAPKRSAVEATASIFAGHPISGGEGHFFERRPGGIQLTDGSVVTTTVDHHPEPIAEALRWRATNGELGQAVGRLRPHRRSAPCWLDIVCDVPLPIRAHTAVRWNDVTPGAEADMAATGMILTNNRDAMTAFELSDWEARGVGGISIESLIRDSTDSSPVRKFSYQKTGSGQKRHTGYYLPAILTGGEIALRAWMEERLGPLASLEIELARVKDSDRAKAVLAKTWRAIEDRFKFQNAFTPVLESIEAFFADLDGQNDKGAGL